MYRCVTTMLKHTNVYTRRNCTPTHVHYTTRPPNNARTCAAYSLGFPDEYDRAGESCHCGISLKSLMLAIVDDAINSME